MSASLPGTAPAEKSPEDRLDSWKEIAVYLGRDVTTVQRWEKREAMPVHRHLHDKVGTVFAFRMELDAWVRTRNLRPRENEDTNPSADPPTPSPASASTSRRGIGNFIWFVAVTTVLLALSLGLWLNGREYFWRNPVSDAKFQTITDFDGVEQAAAVSRDGHFAAFLSDRDGPMDVWVTQIGSGQFHNLTHGNASELVNPSIRSLSFTPDGSSVTYWARKQDGSTTGDISIWGVPTLGGQPTIYLQGAAEFDWSADGTRLAYHTPGPGDPLFISDGSMLSGGHVIFTAPTGLHSHFPLWAHDASIIYFVQGTLPDQLDIWRIRSAGGSPDRITSHNARVSYPVLLNRRTLMYLVGDPDGSGSSLYSVDVERRAPHRLISGPERYTSLAASADGHRLVATLSTPKRTLWRLRISDSPAGMSAVAPISLTTSTGFSPRIGPNYLLYVSEKGAGESIWKLTGGASTELWNSETGRVLSSPAISPDGRAVAFVVSDKGQILLYVMHADGTNARIVTNSLDLQGDPVWAPDGQSITSAVVEHGIPRLFRIPIDGQSPIRFVQNFSVDPMWAKDGSFVAYSGPDIGTTFSVKAVTADSKEHPLPPLTLTRGARHLAFLSGGRMIVLLRGEIQHKNLWLVDLQTGAERQLTNLPADFDIHDFDISPDGSELVLERVQLRSDVVLIDLPRP
jgi:Tol biopolymer transport system component